MIRVSQCSAKEIRLLERTDGGLGALRLGLLRMGVSPHVRGGIQESLLSELPNEVPLKGNWTSYLMGFYSDLMGFYGDLMGFYEDLMGFYSDLMGFYSDLMGFYGDLMGFMVI